MSFPQKVIFEGKLYERAQTQEHLSTENSNNNNNEEPIA